eukprot:TRINITY_DN6070_c0_g1_i1.p1 TRINITY_DN6070_c0_g1~~TRINITY_DN6070_c0_g1_i1.p1  ORF type:complete len:1271 (-),score=165.09 TRINITY_DN6070_c0_g1_i1:261-3680(-)
MQTATVEYTIAVPAESSSLTASSVQTYSQHETTRTLGKKLRKAFLAEGLSGLHFAVSGLRVPRIVQLTTTPPSPRGPDGTHRNGSVLASDVNRAHTSSLERFDCQAGLAVWRIGWSKEKQKWCCQSKNIACAGEKQKKKKAKQEKKTNEKKHSPHAASHATSEPFDCQKGPVWWRIGWAKPKQTWCCEHKHLGCVRETNHITTLVTTSEPFDCHAGLAEWRMGWAKAKQKWCCHNKQVACAVSPNKSPRTMNITGVVKLSVDSCADLQTREGHQALQKGLAAYEGVPEWLMTVRSVECSSDRRLNQLQEMPRFLNDREDEATVEYTFPANIQHESKETLGEALQTAFTDAGLGGLRVLDLKHSSAAQASTTEAAPNHGDTQDQRSKAFSWYVGNMQRKRSVESHNKSSTSAPHVETSAKPSTTSHVTSPRVAQISGLSSSLTTSHVTPPISTSATSSTSSMMIRTRDVPGIVMAAPATTTLTSTSALVVATTTLTDGSTSPRLTITQTAALSSEATTSTATTTLLPTSTIVTVTKSSTVEPTATLTHTSETRTIRSTTTIFTESRTSLSTTSSTESSTLPQTTTFTTISATTLSLTTETHTTTHEPTRTATKTATWAATLASGASAERDLPPESELQPTQTTTQTGPLGEEGEDRDLPPAGSRSKWVGLTMLVSNVSYDQLSKAAHRQRFIERFSRALELESGQHAKATHVDISPAGESVLVRATLESPNDVNVSRLQSVLARSLTQPVAEAARDMPKATKGDVTVTDVRAFPVVHGGENLQNKIVKEVDSWALHHLLFLIWVLVLCCLIPLLIRWLLVSWGRPSDARFGAQDWQASQARMDELGARLEGPMWESSTHGAGGFEEAFNRELLASFPHPAENDRAVENYVLEGEYSLRAHQDGSGMMPVASQQRQPFMTIPPSPLPSHTRQTYVSSSSTLPASPINTDLLGSFGHGQGLARSSSGLEATHYPDLVDLSTPSGSDARGRMFREASGSLPTRDPWEDARSGMLPRLVGVEPLRLPSAEDVQPVVRARVISSSFPGASAGYPASNDHLSVMGGAYDSHSVVHRMLGESDSHSVVNQMLSEARVDPHAVVSGTTSSFYPAVPMGQFVPGTGTDAVVQHMLGEPPGYDHHRWTGH